MIYSLLDRARRWSRGSTPHFPSVILLQTADGGEYADMLAVSRTANESYAARHGFGYHCYIGIKRGYFRWHAAFNRVFLINEFVSKGFRGWIFYLDADAFVHDRDFDLAAYLDRYSDKALIAGPGGIGMGPWDVNSGVFLINLGHKLGRQLIKDWQDDIMRTTDEQLRNAPNWQDVPSDQPRLHGVLRGNPRYLAALHVAERSFFNDYKASFVHHALRGQAGLSASQRIAIMKEDIGTSGT